MRWYPAQACCVPRNQHHVRRQGGVGGRTGHQRIRHQLQGRQQPDELPSAVFELCRADHNLPLQGHGCPSQQGEQQATCSELDGLERPGDQAPREGEVFRSLGRMPTQEEVLGADRLQGAVAKTIPTADCRRPSSRLRTKHSRLKWAKSASVKDALMEPQEVRAHCDPVSSWHQTETEDFWPPRKSQILSGQSLFMFLGEEKLPRFQRLETWP